MGSKTFRTDLYSGYKANRPAPPEELVPQFDLVKEVVEAFNIPNIGKENYEADDCIGTLSQTYAAENEVIILTGDRDMLQLVDKGVTVAIMLKGQGNYDIFDHTNFFNKQGITPKQIIDLKALMGDSADNYPGVKGIGEKTALKLLREYGTIEHILLHIDELPKGIKTKLKTNLDMLHLSRELAQIYCEVPVGFTLADAKWQYDKGRTEDKFNQLELKHLGSLI